MNKEFAEGLKKLFLDYETISPFYLLFYMVFSLGFYLFFWLYRWNLKFETFDDDAPDSRRGLIVLFVMPLFLYLLILFLDLILFDKFEFIIYSVSVLGWSMIIFLSLKYIYDFCLCFGKWTASSGLWWYLFLYPGYFAFILSLYKFYWTAPLLFFTIIAVPSMQAFINYKEEEFRRVRERDFFNTRERAA